MYRAMLTNLTVYAYVMGEITNMVMSSDAALVATREEMARVEMFVAKHDFPLDLAQARPPPLPCPYVAYAHAHTNPCREAHSAPRWVCNLFLPGP